MFELSILQDFPAGFEGVVLACVLFFPAAIANMMPVFANKIPKLNQWHTPMDFGKTWKGVRLFGDHKTWRGFITGTVIGSILGLALFWGVAELRGLDFAVLPHLLFASSLSAGALLGDVIKSFFKRRTKVAPGKSWFPFDQIDYIIGGLILATPFQLPLVFIISIIPVYFGGVLGATYIAWLLKLKQDPI